MNINKLNNIKSLKQNKNEKNKKSKKNLNINMNKKTTKQNKKLLYKKATYKLNNSKLNTFKGGSIFNYSPTSSIYLIDTFKIFIKLLYNSISVITTLFRGNNQIIPNNSLSILSIFIKKFLSFIAKNSDLITLYLFIKDNNYLSSFFTSKINKIKDIYGINVNNKNKTIETVIISDPIYKEISNKLDKNKEYYSNYQVLLSSNNLKKNYFLNLSDIIFNLDKKYILSKETEYKIMQKSVEVNKKSLILQELHKFNIKYAFNNDKFAPNFFYEIKKDLKHLLNEILNNNITLNEPFIDNDLILKNENKVPLYFLIYKHINLQKILHFIETIYNFNNSLISVDLVNLIFTRNGINILEYLLLCNLKKIKFESNNFIQKLLLIIEKMDYTLINKNIIKYYVYNIFLLVEEDIKFKDILLFGFNNLINKYIKNIIDNENLDDIIQKNYKNNFILDSFLLDEIIEFITLKNEINNNSNININLLNAIIEIFLFKNIYIKKEINVKKYEELVIKNKLEEKKEREIEKQKEKLGHENKQENQKEKEEQNNIKKQMNLPHKTTKKINRETKKYNKSLKKILYNIKEKDIVKDDLHIKYIKKNDSSIIKQELQMKLNYGKMYYQLNDDILFNFYGKRKVIDETIKKEKKKYLFELHDDLKSNIYYNLYKYKNNYLNSNLSPYIIKKLEINEIKKNTSSTYNDLQYVNIKNYDEIEYINYEFLYKNENNLFEFKKNTDELFDKDRQQIIEYRKERFINGPFIKIYLNLESVLNDNHYCNVFILKGKFIFNIVDDYSIFIKKNKKTYVRVKFSKENIDFTLLEDINVELIEGISDLFTTDEEKKKTYEYETHKLKDKLNLKESTFWIERKNIDFSNNYSIPSNLNNFNFFKTPLWFKKNNLYTNFSYKDFDLHIFNINTLKALINQIKINKNKKNIDIQVFINNDNLLYASNNTFLSKPIFTLKKGYKLIPEKIQSPINSVYNRADNVISTINNFIPENLKTNIKKNIKETFKVKNGNTKYNTNTLKILEMFYNNEINYTLTKLNNDSDYTEEIVNIFKLYTSNVVYIFLINTDIIINSIKYIFNTDNMNYLINKINKKIYNIEVNPNIKITKDSILNSISKNSKKYYKNENENEKNIYYLVNFLKNNLKLINFIEYNGNIYINKTQITETTNRKEFVNKLPEFMRYKFTNTSQDFIYSKYCINITDTLTENHPFHDYKIVYDKINKKKLIFSSNRDTDTDTDTDPINKISLINLLNIFNNINEIANEKEMKKHYIISEDLIQKLTKENTENQDLYSHETIILDIDEMVVNLDYKDEISIST